jgi:hypothetical protein
MFRLTDVAFVPVVASQPAAEAGKSEAGVQALITFSFVRQGNSSGTRSSLAAPPGGTAVAQVDAAMGPEEVRAVSRAFAEAADKAEVVQKLVTGGDRVDTSGLMAGR